MKNMRHLAVPKIFWLFTAASSLAILAGCSSLLPALPPKTTFYALDNVNAKVQTAQSGALSKKATIIINTPRAAAGFDSPHMMYVREAHKLEYFAQNEWVDTPSRMLAPLLVSAMQKSQSFHAVVQSPSNVVSDFRLDTEIVHLQQNFETKPSTVQFKLRVYMINNETRKVIAWHEFEDTVVSKNENAAGGAEAANLAVQNVLNKVAAFSADLMVY